MIKKDSKNVLRKQRHDRLRQKLHGTEKRPRLSVFRSNLYMYCQIIDDEKATTLLAANTKELKDVKNNIEAAKKLGALIAEKALKKGIKQVVFDRGGYMYHGRVKALAEAAREKGLQF